MWLIVRVYLVDSRVQNVLSGFGCDEAMCLELASDLADQSRPSLKM